MKLISKLFTQLPEYCEARAVTRCTLQKGYERCHYPDSKYQCRHYMKYKYENVDDLEREQNQKLRDVNFN